MKRTRIGSMHAAAFARRDAAVLERVPRFVRALLARHGLEPSTAGVLAMPLLKRAGVIGAQVTRFVERRLALNLTLQLRSVYRADPALAQRRDIAAARMPLAAAPSEPLALPRPAMGFDDAPAAAALTRVEVAWVQSIVQRWQSRVPEAHAASALPGGSLLRDVPMPAFTARGRGPELAMPVVQRLARSAAGTSAAHAPDEAGAPEREGMRAPAAAPRASAGEPADAAVERWPERVVERLAERVIGSIDRRIAARRERLGGA